METFGRLALFAGLAALYPSCCFSDLSSSKKFLKFFLHLKNSAQRGSLKVGQFENKVCSTSNLSYNLGVPHPLGLILATNGHFGNLGQSEVSESGPK